MPFAQNVKQKTKETQTLKTVESTEIKKNWFKKLYDQFLQSKNKTHTASDVVIVNSVENGGTDTTKEKPKDSMETKPTQRTVATQSQKPPTTHDPQPSKENREETKTNLSFPNKAKKSAAPKPPTLAKELSSTKDHEGPLSTSHPPRNNQHKEKLKEGKKEDVKKTENETNTKSSPALKETLLMHNKGEFSKVKDRSFKIQDNLINVSLKKLTITNDIPEETEEQEEEEIAAEVFFKKSDTIVRLDVDKEVIDYQTQEEVNEDFNNVLNEDIEKSLKLNDNEPESSSSTKYSKLKKTFRISKTKIPKWQRQSVPTNEEPSSSSAEPKNQEITNEQQQLQQKFIATTDSPNNLRSSVKEGRSRSLENIIDNPITQSEPQEERKTSKTPRATSTKRRSWEGKLQNTKRLSIGGPKSDSELHQNLINSDVSLSSKIKIKKNAEVPKKAQSVQSAPVREPVLPLEKYQENSCERIDTILDEVREIEREMDDFFGITQDDKDYVYMDEVMMRNLIKLDGIETRNNQILRQKRKEAIQFVQNSMRKLNERLDENKTFLGSSSSDFSLGNRIDSDEELTKNE